MFHRVGYTRKQIQSINTPALLQKVINDIVQKDIDNQQLTLAEQDLVGRWLNTTTFKVEPPFIDRLRKYGENYKFVITYLPYSEDLLGKDEVYDFFGRIENEKRKRDVAFLRKIATDWEKEIFDNPTHSTLIDFAAKEVRKQIELLRRFKRLKKITQETYDYFRHSIVLQSKYTYLIVTQFFEDYGKEQILTVVNSQAILIDADTHIHILSGHFASRVKGYQVGKSYIGPIVDFRTVPLWIELSLLLTFRTIITVFDQFQQ